MSRPRLNTYEKIPHRLDGLDVRGHYMKVIKRVQKYSRRLTRVGFTFDKKRDVFIRGKNHVTLDYIESFCDFTVAEFESRYGN